MIKKLSNENGSALVIVMMVLVVVSALGGALGMVTINSHRLAEHTQDTNSAYYIAEAGANMAYEEIRSQIEEFYHDKTSREMYFQEISSLVSSTPYNNFTSQSGKQPKATITLEGPVGDGDIRYYTIVSTGEVGGKKRIVNKIFDIKWIQKESNDGLQTPPENLALAYTNKFTVGNDSKVIGNIFYQENANQSSGDRFTHELGIPTINNNIGDYQKKIKDQLSSEIQEHISHNIDFSSLPPIGNIEYGHDVQVDEDAITSNGTVKLLDRAVIEGNIYTKNGNIEIGSYAVVKGDIITDNGKVGLSDRARVEGDIITKNGEVEIGNQAVVTKSVKTRNGSITLQDHAEVHEGIITENSHIKIGSESNFIGPVITGRGHITFGGNLEVFGNIITGNGKIDFANGVQVNGAIITGNGAISAGTDFKIIGTVIGSKIDSGDRMLVEYSDNYTDDFPFGASSTGVVVRPDISELTTSQPAIEK